MNILLIAPASGHWRHIARRRLFNGRTFRFSMLSLLTVAALSPRHARVTIVDEQIEDVPDGDWDLVGITAMTAAAPRAYELCAQFKAEGIPVVMGGFHATLNPQEALLHADAIVRGPAYGAWEKVCDDAANGVMKREYQGDLTAQPPVHLPRHLLNRRGYVTASSTFATLGCANACAFCSIHRFNGGQRYQRPVRDVVEELALLRNHFFLFVDDNLTQDRPYALELLTALRPLGKKWATQVSVETASDPELLMAMRDAGCLGVFIGFETYDTTALLSQSKGFNAPGRYHAAVDAFHKHGMYVEAGVIVGFDTDGPDVFKGVLKALERTEIDTIQLSILTPLPGTALHESMADRITCHDWACYDYRHVVFEPAGMTATQLQEGADWLINAYYSPWRILRRVPRWINIPGGWRHFLYPLTLNLAYWGRTFRFGIRGKAPRDLVLTGPLHLRMGVGRR